MSLLLSCYFVLATHEVLLANDWKIASFLDCGWVGLRRCRCFVPVNGMRTALRVARRCMRRSHSAAAGPNPPSAHARDHDPVASLARKNARMVKHACSGLWAYPEPTGQARRARQPPVM